MEATLLQFRPRSGEETALFFDFHAFTGLPLILPFTSEFFTECSGKAAPLVLEPFLRPSGITLSPTSDEVRDISTLSECQPDTGSCFTATSLSPTSTISPSISTSTNIDQMFYLALLKSGRRKY